VVVKDKLFSINVSRSRRRLLGVVYHWAVQERGSRFGRKQLSKQAGSLNVRMSPNMIGAQLNGAQLAGADFHGADLSGGSLSRTGLHETDFSEANLSKVVITRKW
jgi:uncharacterized protein YjbI with pentapeptide repeats